MEIPFSVLGEHWEYCRSGRALCTETKERRTWDELGVRAEALEYIHMPGLAGPGLHYCCFCVGCERMLLQEGRANE